MTNRNLGDIAKCLTTRRNMVRIEIDADNLR